mgnify:CR=1 FL=1
MKLSQRAQRIEPFYVMEMGKTAALLAQQFAHTDRPMIALNIGEPDFTAPPLVQAAAHQAIQDGQTQYTHALSPAIPLPFLETIQKASAITVNKVHGDSNSIAATISKYPVHVESMEGAAFFYACAQVELASIQLRAISNWVEPRNRDAWNIPLAIANLNQSVAQLLSE